jgi:uncharacterized protein (TIGR02001 family)
MRFLALSVIAGTGLVSVISGSQAADLPAKTVKQMPAEAAAPATPSFDIAFGVRGVSDYNFRGISQTDRKPGIQGYAELQLFENFLYAGVAGYSVDLPTKPDAEVDFTAGIRPKWGPFSFDLGVIQYYYPGEQRFVDAFGNILTPKNTDFTELAAKVSYTWQDTVTLGANIFHAWDWLGSGADGTYASLTAKTTLPFLAGLSASGEFGHYWLGTTSPQLGSIALPDYLYWNAGVSYTWKLATLDLRYHDTNVSKAECFTLTADPSGVFSGSGRSKWCSPSFIASVSFDTTLSTMGVFDRK